MKGTYHIFGEDLYNRFLGLYPILGRGACKKILMSEPCSNKNFFYMPHFLIFFLLPFIFFIFVFSLNIRVGFFLSYPNMKLKTPPYTLFHG